jgi:uncharacterized membrane protein YccF (DUF307 family)
MIDKPLTRKPNDFEETGAFLTLVLGCLIFCLVLVLIINSIPIPHAMIDYGLAFEFKPYGYMAVRHEMTSRGYLAVFSIPAVLFVYAVWYIARLKD